MSVDLSDYVEVHDRIAAFYEKFPEGSLQSSWELLTLNEQETIVVEARAFRTAADPRPGIGLASEPVPGLTPYTKGSELMNAETSAWGRALAALGFEVKRGIASANEVRNRQGDSHTASRPMSDKQRNLFERLLKEAKLSGEDLAVVLDWSASRLTGGRAGTASDAIDGLMSDKEATAARLLEAAKKWASEQSVDPPPDMSDLPEAA